MMNAEMMQVYMATPRPNPPFRSAEIDQKTIASDIATE